jgi:hypothetical protein
MHMKFDTKHVAGVAAVIVAAVYSISRWRDASNDAGEQAPTTEHRSPAAD